MDAKSKANFINSIAEQAAETTTSNDAPAFAPAVETAVEPAEAVKTVAVKYVEPQNVFAQGLPEWSIEPPQVMVRRH